MQYFIIILLTSSATMSVLAILYMVASPILANRYSEKGRYYAWLIIIFGLIIPFRPQFNNPIIEIDMPSETIEPVVHIESETLVLTPTAAPLSSVINISWCHAATIVWLLGMIVLLVYHFIKYCAFVKMVNRWGKNTPDEQILFMFQEIKSNMGTKKNIDLHICPCVGGPIMIGFVNPQIFLPTENIAHNELYFILKHELVHHKRKDLLYKYLVLTATLIHWFNPVVYFVAKAITELCEMSCDSEVVRSADTNTRLSYSKTIIGVASYQSRLNTALSTNFYGGKKSMKNRISSIMDTHKKKAGLALFCFILVVSVFSSNIFALNTPNINKQTTFANRIDFQSYPLDSEAEVNIAKAKKIIELESGIRNFYEVDHALVYLFLNNGIISANITLITGEEISYSIMESILLFVSENVEGLDKENIQIQIIDTNTDTSLDSEAEVNITKAKQAIELENGIRNFYEVDHAMVYLFLNNGIISANITLITSEEISYSIMESILLFVSENVEGLDKENIQIQIID